MKDKAKHAEYMKGWRERLPAEKRKAIDQRVSQRRRDRKADPVVGKRERKRVRKRVNERYRNDPAFRARVIAQATANYQRLRAAIVAAYGGKCVCCGEDEPLFLEIDHVNGDGQAHRRQTGSVVSSYRDIVKREFPPDYRLLCANCNRGRQRNGGHCPHEFTDTSLPRLVR